MIYWKYLRQVIKHRYHVTIQCWKMGLWWAPLFHDNSKLWPSEFKAYANYYMRPSPAREQFGEAYDYAWNGHWKKNKHHWQYWVVDMHLDGEDRQPRVRVLRIPSRYLKEMIADWIAAGISYTGSDNLDEWWGRNKNKMVLHPITRYVIESYIRSRKEFPHAAQLYLEYSEVDNGYAQT